jgi:hypothetical protein
MRFFSVLILILSLAGCAAHTSTLKRTSHSQLFVACFAGGAQPYWAGPVKAVTFGEGDWIAWTSTMSSDSFISNGGCLVVESPLKPLSSKSSEANPSVVILPSE